MKDSKDVEGGTILYLIFAKIKKILEAVIFCDYVIRSMYLEEDFLQEVSSKYKQ